MKRIVLALALAGCSSLALADVGVSVSVGQPGFYGQINLGDVQPQVVYAQPVMVQPVPVNVPPPAPIYLHVPPGYERHWARHCAAYGACGRPVYFVRHDWYNNVYVPHYQQHPEVYRGDWHGGPGRYDDHHDHHDRDHGDWHDH